MEEHREGVAFPPRVMGAAEGQMVRADLVREIVARRERGESSRQIARELAVDRKTVRRWLRIGGWQPRQGGERPRAIDPYIEFIERRGPEVGWNGVVLHRELVALGFSGSYQQVQRLLKPRRDRRRWQEAATVRFETEPGEQAQVDYGQLQVWIGEQPETVHLFVFTLGYSRRLFTRWYRNERLATLLDGHERAFRHFGGVTLSCLYDYVARHIIVQDRTWHSAEELEADPVPFAEGFGALRRVGLHQTTIAVRQIHREEMDLALLTCDHRERFAEVGLRVSRIVAQRHEHLAQPLPPLVHIVLYDRDPASIPVLIAQPLEDPFRSMLLFGRL